ncbi:MAG: SCO family protein [Alphaproteobacteria bacterium]
MRLALALVLAAGLTPAAQAHDRALHSTTAQGVAQGTGAALPFPIEITPRFALIDQTGRAVTQADFSGRPMAIFFGYANCAAICSVALPSLAAALDLLGQEGAEIAPILITVDPARDTPAAMARRLAQYHPRLIGLTGSEAALAEARAVFQVEASQVAKTPEGAPLYAHGSVIYLVGRDGVVKSVLPPILPPERIAELMRKYL